VLLQVLRLGYRSHEVPIRYYARSREEGKKLTWTEGVRALGVLARLRTTSDQGLFGASRDEEYHRTRQQELARQHPLLRR